MLRWIILALLTVPTVALGATRAEVQKRYRATLELMYSAEQHAQNSVAAQDHFRTALILLRATEKAFAKKDYRAADGVTEQAATYARFTGKTLSLAELTRKYAPYVGSAQKEVPAGGTLLGGKWKAYVSPGTVGYSIHPPRGSRAH